MLQAADVDQHLAVPLVSLLADKNKDARAAARDCLYQLARHSSATKRGCMKAMRDALPAAKRVLEPQRDPAS